MKITENVTTYEDFKYVMQDTGNVYIGAAYSYEELLEQERTPFKLKAIITHYILKETTTDTTIESELYYLTQEKFLFELFKQLKVKVKIQVQVEKKGWFGQTHTEYAEKIYSLAELTEMNLARKKASGLLIREMIIPKLALMSFSI